MLDNLSEAQEEMLMYALKEVGSNAQQRSVFTELIESLAKDEKVLTKLRKMLHGVKSKQFSHGYH